MSVTTVPSSPCIFCNIINKLENTEILYDDEDVCIFRDIKPATRFHVLTIPKRHIEDVKCLSSADKDLDLQIITVAELSMAIAALWDFLCGANCSIEMRLKKKKRLLLIVKNDFISGPYLAAFSFFISYELHIVLFVFIVAKMLAVSQELLTKNNLSVQDARFGYHWPPFRSVRHLHLHTIAPESEMGFIAKMIFKKDSYWFVSPEYVASRL